MNANKLKLIACISMLLDHAGLLLFPHLLWMRFVGRLAMPIFGFFIAEGARYTSCRTRYFLRTFSLGVACQLIYSAEEILSGGMREIYLNILFTLSIAMLVCFAYIDFEKSLVKRDTAKIFLHCAIFVLSVTLVILFDIFCTHSRSLCGIKITLDYGAAGALLPLFAIIGKTPRARLVSFCVGLVLFILALQSSMWFIGFAIFVIPLLFLYNGQRGNSKFKYAFYIFYPLHLGVLYLIDIII